MLAWILALILSVVAVTPAAAQQNNTNVTREQSRLLVDMPGTRGGHEGFQYIGWTSNYSMEGHFAFASASTSYPHARVWMTVLSRSHLWVNHGPMNEARLREMAPYLKDQAARPLSARPVPSSRNTEVVLFEVDGGECAIFSIRDLSTPRGAGAVDLGTRGFYGVYCGAKGATLTKDLLEDVLGGIYFRHGGAVYRAYGDGTRPIPDHILRGPPLRGEAAPLAPVPG